MWCWVWVVDSSENLPVWCWEPTSGDGGSSLNWWPTLGAAWALHSSASPTKKPSGKPLKLINLEYQKEFILKLIVIIRYDINLIN